jgi:16S rRNA (guanine527-N7)-methyltransferase
VFHVKLNTRSIVEHLSEGQIELLRRFTATLRERAVPLGLISESDSERIWDRHVVDSLRGLACLGTEDRAAVDLGSGAGLPGIPLAIVLPKVSFTLVEPKRRRIAFLEAVTQELGLANVAVAPVAAEQAASGVQVCLVRALAPPRESWRMASPLLSPRGRVVYWAGRTWGEEDIGHLAKLGASAEICLKPEFQWQGPLVIMARSSHTSLKDHEPTRRSVRRDAEGPSAQH